MADLEYGIQHGLAQDFGGEQRLQDLRYRDQINKQNRALSVAKEQMLSSDLDFQTAQNAHDNPISKERSMKTVLAIGQFRREHPNWEIDPVLRAQVNLMKRDLLDNPDLLRGVATDNAFKQMNADLTEVAKNPNMHNQKAYQDLQLQRDNYLKYGNQHGIDALMSEGKKAFIYEKPADFIDLTEKGQKIGNNFQDVKVEKLNNGRSGAWETKPNENTLNKDAYAYYIQHKDQFDQQHPENPVLAAKQFIQSGIPKKFDYGNTSLQDAITLEGYKAKHKAATEKAISQGKSAYVETVLKYGKTVSNPKWLGATFGQDIKHAITNNDGSVVIDNTGDNFQYTGEIQDQNYKSDGKYKPNGVKSVDGYVYKPLSWAKENKVILDNWGSSGAYDDTDYDVNDKWNKVAQIVPNPKAKDGDDKYIVKLKVRADVQANNAAYQGAFDSQIEPNKLQEATGVQSDYLAEPMWNGIKVGTVGNYKGKKVIITENGPQEVK